MATAALIYGRESRDKEGAARHVGDQHRACERYATANNITITERYSDNSLSASSLHIEREGFDYLCARLEAGPERLVLVTAVTRLTRRDGTGGRFVDIMRKIRGQVIVVPVADSIKPVTYDFTQQEDLERFRDKLRDAYSESETKSIRMLGAHERAREDRRWLGGSSPYGWYREPYIDTSKPKAVIRTRWPVDDRPGPKGKPSPAEEVRAMFRAIIAGYSMDSIATDLNTRGVTPPGADTIQGSKAWYPRAVREILRNPRYAGYYALKDGNGKWQIYTQPEGQEFAFAAIVDFDTWQTAQAVLDRVKGARGTGYRNDQKWPEAGLYFCGACNQRLIVGGREGGKILRHIPKSRSGPCPANHACTFSQPESWEYISNLIDRYILSAPLRRRQKTTRDFGAELADLDRQMDDLARALTDGEMTPILAGRAEKGLIAKRAEIEEERSKVQADPVPVINFAIAANWRSLSLNEQRRVVFGVFEKVTVTPGRQGFAPFDSTRFTPVFRDLDSPLNDLLIGHEPGWEIVEQWLKELSGSPEAPRDATGQLQVSDSMRESLYFTLKSLQAATEDGPADPDYIPSPGFLQWVLDSRRRTVERYAATQTD